MSCAKSKSSSPAGIQTSSRPSSSSFSASFKLVNPDSEELDPALSAEQGGNRDLGIMLYDMDFSNPKDIKAMFYRAEMKEGVIIVPPLNSEEILR